MTVSFRQAPVRVRFGSLGLGLILLLGAVFLFLPPDGVERAESAQFIGQFHLLTVHFPIVLVLLIPVLELAGRESRFLHLRASVDFVWALAAVSSTAAAVLGWCLAWSGGYSGRLVTQHMWGGLSVAALCCVCWMMREHGRLYLLLLLAAVAVVSFTGYRGGQLSQGENHLTEHMPVELKRLIGVSVNTVVPRSDPAFFYGAHVEPILIDHCYECHGPDKQKGRLRMDSFAGVMKGGKHGVVIKAGNAKGSELMRRIALPSSDDDAMPPQGKRPLSPNEIKILEVWIAAGASPTVAANGIKDAPLSAEPVAAEAKFEEIDPAAVAKARAALGPTVQGLQKKYPGVVNYESRGSAMFAIDASLMGAKFGDEDLAALAPIGGQIATADFSGTGITDKSAAVLAAMKQLRVLRLMHTKITDSTVTALGGLDHLESLSVFDTAVTPASLGAMERLPKLQHLYAASTKIATDADVPAGMKGKVVF
jgi:hypothetical protein